MAAVLRSLSWRESERLFSEFWSADKSCVPEAVGMEDASAVKQPFSILPSEITG